MEFIMNHSEIILVAVAVLAFVIALVRILKKAHKIDREGIETDAVVTRIEKDFDPDTAADGYTTYVQYTDENNECRESPVSLELTQTYEVGQKIRIRYLPGEHSLVRPVKDTE